MHSSTSPSTVQRGRVVVCKPCIRWTNKRKMWKLIILPLSCWCQPANPSGTDSMVGSSRKPPICRGKQIWHRTGTRTTDALAHTGWTSQLHLSMVFGRATVFIGITLARGALLADRKTWCRCDASFFHESDRYAGCVVSMNSYELWIQSTALRSGSAVGGS